MEIYAHFERPCFKLKNVSSKLKTLKSKLENLKKNKPANFMSEFRFYISFWILILGFQIWFLFFKFI